MKLMTKALEKKFEKFPMLSQDGLGEEAEVVVKYFNPYGRGTWLITEGEKRDDGDWMLYGYCHIFDWEWGDVLLSQLESIKPFPGMPLGIERDLHCEGMKVKDLVY